MSDHTFDDIKMVLREERWTRPQLARFAAEIATHAESVPERYELVWGELNSPSNTRKLVTHGIDIEVMATMSGNKRSKIRQMKFLDDGFFLKTVHGIRGKPALTAEQYRAVQNNGGESGIVKRDEATEAILLP